MILENHQGIKVHQKVQVLTEARVERDNIHLRRETHHNVCGKSERGLIKTHQVP